MPSTKVATSAPEVLDTLRSLGTEKNRLTFARHGYGEAAFGVSFADLEKLRKQIRSNHDLADELWRTGNFDACNLATLIAEPARMTAGDLDRWVESVDSRGAAGMFSRHVVAKTPFAREKVDAWTQSKDELIEETGYQVLSCLAALPGDGQDLPDTYFADWLVRIEATIHGARNHVRHAMNNSLIAIGVRNPALRTTALAAAARIGKVQVDHGDTACKTPDAIAYIEKAAKRQKAPAKKSASR